VDLIDKSTHLPAAFYHIRYNMRIYLGGHLNYFHPEKDRWLDVEIHEPTPLPEILLSAGIPLEEVQLVAVNGEVISLKNAVVSEGDEIKIFPAVGGG
jgi:sulfur carrier protein ThiS